METERSTGIACLERPERMRISRLFYRRDNCSDCSIFINSRGSMPASQPPAFPTKSKRKQSARKDQSVQNRSRLITLSPDIECTCSFVSIIGNDSLAQKKVNAIEPQSKSRLIFSNRFDSTQCSGPARHQLCICMREKCFDVSIKTSPA
jgi:hypothetical protein